MLRTCLCGMVLLLACTAFAAEPPKRPSLAAELAALKVPPDWVPTTPTQWDMSKPWKDARLEVRRLLAFADEARNREAVKLTWLYAQKKDINDGHELPMYLFMSGNYAWATVEFPPYLKRVAGTGATHGYLCYASCLEHFGEFDKAMAVLDQAEKDLPAQGWHAFNLAKIQEHRADVFAQMNRTEDAQRLYSTAIESYRSSRPPFGGHLLPRHVARVQNKQRIMAMQSLADAKLRDGSYVGKAIGYSDKKDMVITVTVRQGRIADVKVEHEEKIELNATRIIPQRIVEKQSLNVDAITGATVTSQAIIEGAYQAIQRAQ